MSWLPYKFISYDMKEWEHRKRAGGFLRQLTVGQFLIKYIVVRTEGIKGRGHPWKTKFSSWMTKR